jgi:hypothetical protein
VSGWDDIQSDYAKGLNKGYYKKTTEKLASNSLVSTARGEERRGEDNNNTHTSSANVPTWDEVKQLAQMRGVPEASAKTFFDHHEGNSLWINQHGKLINWQHKLTSWATTDRQPKPNHASRSTNQPTTPNRNAGTFNDKPLSAAARAKVL